MQSDIHVAIIMDGNGRWASRRGLHRLAGHRAGVTAVRRVVEHASDSGIKALTLYAFSSDNWRRPEHEVQHIFWLLRAYLRLETDRLKRRGARLQVIGRRDRLPRLLLREIVRTESQLAAGDGLHIRVAIDYSSRYEIVRALQNATASLSHDQPCSADVLRYMVSRALTSEAKDVDLLIRTGGEKRLSDFLLWESAYAELVFCERMWPDFEVADFEMALQDFRRRERRFGTVPVPADGPPIHSGGAQ